MNTLEKILEEIKRIEDEYCYEVHSPMFCMGTCSMAADVKEIIYSHMKEISDDGWIPVDERLPEVPEGTEYDNCPEFNVTIKGASKATTLKYAPDGTWFDDSGEVYNVMAWQPLPEPYRPEEG
nr:DUF551 domain-containing protein [uncultured Blautia sp.]